MEEAALDQAELECLADADVRARRQERAAARCAEQDREYVARFAQTVRAQYPGCPPGREQVIAEHACLKYSGRVGRSAAARELDEEAARLAVVAHVRHAETAYEELLVCGYERHDARGEIVADVERVLVRWGAES